MSKNDFYNKFPHRKCPVCDTTDSRILFRQHFLEMSHGGLMTGYDVVVCTFCGVGFADHIPEQHAFDEHYKNMSKYEYQDADGKESDYDLARFRQIFNLLQPFLPDRAARILDVGCSTGRLLSLFRENGFLRVLGLDPSAVCASSAKKLYDVEVLTKTLTELESEATEYGCIILSGVLEHVCDLGSVLPVMRRLLADNGKIFIEVPDATRFAHHPDAPYQQFSTEHINFFSRVSLQNLMRRYGFAETYNSQGTRDQTADAVMPVVSAIYGKDPMHGEKQSLKDSETEIGLMEYIRMSRDQEDKIHEVINGLVNDAIPLIVWGAGTLTLRLLATSRLAKANIRSFVDSNPRLHGSKLNGIQVISPSMLQGRKESIVICSRVFQQSIENQIVNDLRLSNNIIKLYNE